MLTTAFTDLVGCTEPVQLAGMGGLGTPELAAAVAEAGGHVRGDVALLPLLDAVLVAGTTTGHIDAMALYAGQGVGLVSAVEPAGSIVRELVDGADALLGRA